MVVGVGMVGRGGRGKGGGGRGRVWRDDGREGGQSWEGSGRVGGGKSWGVRVWGQVVVSCGWGGRAGGECGRRTLGVGEGGGGGSCWFFGS